MAIAGSDLTTSASAAGTSTVATASIAPGSNRLILATVSGIDGAFTTPPIFNLSGNGLTWVSVIRRQYGIFTEETFRAMGASPSSGAVTIGSDRATIVNVTWTISEYTGIDTSGSDGAGAVGNSASAEATSAASLAVTLPAFGSADNATYGAFSAYNLTVTPFTFSPGSGFTELAEASVSGGGAYAGIQSQWRADNDTGVDATTSVTNDYISGIAIEIVAASGGGGSTTIDRLMKTRQINALSGVIHGLY